jgi:hypothetical protein
MPIICTPLNLLIQAPMCLFNVLEDPTEHDNIASSNPDILASMTARLAELQVRYF